LDFQSERPDSAKNNARIDPDVFRCLFLITPERLICLVPKLPQETNLHGGGYVSYLVKKHCAAFGKGKSTGFVLPRIGKSSGLMPKKFAPTQGVGQDATVDGRERLLFSVREVMKRPGKEILSCAACASDEYSACTFGSPWEHVKEARRGRLSTDDTLKNFFPVLPAVHEISLPSPTI
jgi:hypothetical protein